MGDMNFRPIMSNTQPPAEVFTSEPDAVTGYRAFKLGGFEFVRDEYFARISWPAKGERVSHVMPVDAFLRAMMRDVAWGFSTAGSISTRWSARATCMAASNCSAGDTSRR